MDVYNKDFQVISSKDIWSASENSPKTYEYQETLDPGTYYIKLWPHNDDCGRYRIQYKQKIIAKSIAISANKSKVLAGKRVKLSAKISPTNATDKTVRWTSGDRWVASVDENTGMVTTHSAGIVKITASAMDGSGISKVYTLVVWPKKMSAPYGSSPKSKQLYISYGSQSGAKGYEVQYATNSKFRGAKSKRTSKTSFTVKGVQKNRVYYIRVRAYVQRGKSMYRGDWSKTKKVRIK